MIAIGVLVMWGILWGALRRHRFGARIVGSAALCGAVVVAAWGGTARAGYGTARLDDAFRDPPPPPYPAPTIVLRFSWEPMADLRFQYLLISNEHDPESYPFGAAYWYAGCEAGALDVEPPAPLVLQAGSEAPARNWATSSGVYWVVAQSDGYCIYPEDEDRLDRTLASIPEGTEIQVTATVETYEPGAGTPRRETLSASVPVFRDVRELPATRRVLGSVTLAPGTGEPTSVTGATAAPTSTTLVPVGSEAAGEGPPASAPDGEEDGEEGGEGPSALALALAGLLILAVIGGAAAMLALRLDIESEGRLGGLVRFIRRLFGGKGEIEAAKPPPPRPPPPPPPSSTRGPREG